MRETPSFTHSLRNAAGLPKDLLAQIDEVVRTGRVRRTFTLYSPASGVVATKNVVDGQAITAGQSLYTIADLTDVWID